MEYKCGVYCRLSDSDNKVDESSSIQSQEMIINSFANFNKLKIVKTYKDDGFSGGNFDRPGFQEMIKDIESGLINCVITKDLSRLGREMYGTGKYIEQFFMEHRVRYIAINDSYDSDVGDSMLGLRLSVNDLYLRDVSKKVRTSFKAKQMKGDYIGSIPLYGYLKDPTDRHKLIIDENVRGVIECIYELAIDGKSPTKIAEILTLRKEPIPIVYKKEIRAKDLTENNGYGIWKRQTVKGILTNQMYIGNMVQNKFNKISYNSKKKRKTTNEEFIIVNDTHEGIISKDDFDEVQKILESRSTTKRTYKQDKYLLSSLLYCKDCGRTIRVGESIKKSKIVHYTQCNLYTRKGKFGVCSSHCVNYDWLEEDILEYLKTACLSFCNEYGIKDLEDNSSIIIKNNIKEITGKINKLELMIEKTKGTMDSLYMDKVNGLISEDMFKRIYDKSNDELIKYKDDLESLKEKKKINENSEEKTGEFASCKKAILEYLMLKKLDKKLLAKLIKRIEIDSDKKVYVYFSFKNIGLS